MQTPLQLVFRNMEPSTAIEAKVRTRVEQLEKHFDRIISCRVVVEQHHRHRHKGKLFHVRVDLKVPNDDLVVSRDAGQNHAHEDAYVAIRDAFDSTRRRLEDYLRRRRGDVKAHETPPYGRVAELYPGADYGKIQTADGRRVYFHRNSVAAGGFERLEVGTEVRFAEESGELGPQATGVRVVGKHHPVG